MVSVFHLLPLSGIFTSPPSASYVISISSIFSLSKISHIFFTLFLSLEIYIICNVCIYTYVISIPHYGKSGICEKLGAENNNYIDIRSILCAMFENYIHFQNALVSIVIAILIYRTICLVHDKTDNIYKPSFIICMAVNFRPFSH